jgi:hypothetical protein
LPVAATFANLAWHGSENSVRCSFTHARRPSPGLTSAHFDFISPAHAPAWLRCCAVATDTESSTAALEDILPQLSQNKIGAREQIPQDLSIVFLILDHKDALAHDGPACATTCTGKVSSPQGRI